MKITLPKIPIVAFPDDCAKIVETYKSDSGNVYIYEFTIDIDMNSAMLNNINKVTLIASNIASVMQRLEVTDIQLAVNSNKRTLSKGVTFGSAPSLQERYDNPGDSQSGLKEGQLFDTKTKRGSSRLNKTSMVTNALMTTRFNKFVSHAERTKSATALIIDYDTAGIESSINSIEREVARRESVIRSPKSEMPKRKKPSSGITGKVSIKNTNLSSISSKKVYQVEGFEIKLVKIRDLEQINTDPTKIIPGNTLRSERIPNKNDSFNKDTIRDSITEYERDVHGNVRVAHKGSIRKTKYSENKLQGTLEEVFNKKELVTTPSIQTSQQIMWSLIFDYSRPTTDLIVKQTSDFFISADSNFQGTQTFKRKRDKK